MFDLKYCVLCTVGDDNQSHQNRIHRKTCQRQMKNRSPEIIYTRTRRQRDLTYKHTHTYYEVDLGLMSIHSNNNLS